MDLIPCTDSHAVRASLMPKRASPRAIDLSPTPGVYLSVAGLIQVKSSVNSFLVIMSQCHIIMLKIIIVVLVVFTNLRLNSTPVGILTFHVTIIRFHCMVFSCDNYSLAHVASASTINRCRRPILRVAGCPTLLFQPCKTTLRSLSLLHVTEYDV